MSKHTPGPWFARNESIGCAIGWIGRVQHERKADGAFGAASADARLAASAPELLAVARRAAQLAEIASDWNLDQVEIDGEWVSTWDMKKQIDTVIAKAEGGRE